MLREHAEQAAPRAPVWGAGVDVGGVLRVVPAPAEGVALGCCFLFLGTRGGEARRDSDRYMWTHLPFLEQGVVCFLGRAILYVA